MNELVKLTSLKEGDWGIIHSIEGGSAVTGRLAGMGIFPNARFRLTQISGGLIVIEVTDTKIALGQGDASKILVKKMAPTEEVCLPPIEKEIVVALAAQPKVVK
jgi:Fe2+ transport system protein FeoA